MAFDPKNPLHGVTLEGILNFLIEEHGWEEMAAQIPIRCFQLDPSLKSSLTFLRKTPWARKKVENWYVWEVTKMHKAAKAATLAEQCDESILPTAAQDQS
ncbi:MAG: VF530 family protein [Fimbriimonadaceae bacterium]